MCRPIQARDVGHFLHLFYLIVFHGLHKKPTRTQTRYDEIIAVVLDSN